METLPMKIFTLLLIILILPGCNESAQCTCNHWESCSDGGCVLKSGGCDNDSDCTPEKPRCNSDHWCDYPEQNLCETLPCATLYGPNSYCDLHKGLPLCICETGYHLTFEGCISDHCLNHKCDSILTGSTCMFDEIEETPLCVCPEGFDIVENSCIDPCDQLNCTEQLGEGGICDRETLTCGCKTGFKLKEQQCVPDTPCFDIECNQYLANTSCNMVDQNPVCHCANGYYPQNGSCISKLTPPDLCDTIPCNSYIPGSICHLVELNNTQQPGCICPADSTLINGRCHFENPCDGINCDTQIIGSVCTIIDGAARCNCPPDHTNRYGICIQE